MATKSNPVKEGRIAIKDCWHPYGLQSLSPEKFVLVTSLILKGKHGLINFGSKRVIQAGRA